MDYGLYVSAAGADTQSRRLEVLSHNLANVDTPGFKEELAIIQARASRAMQDQLDTPGSGSINNLGSGVSMTGTVTNFSPGTLKHTGAQWDMAIHGDGFFTVDNDGQTLLTRAGNFHVDTFGRLLTDQGYSVLADDGSPIVIDPTQSSQLHEDGFLEQSGGGQLLGMVKPASLGDLARVGKNLFRPLAPLDRIPTQERQVATGFLEMSDVQPARSMMELIETSRAYETNVRMIQNQDQLTGALVNRILKP